MDAADLLDLFADAADAQLAVVEPSTGSTTTVTVASGGPLRPDSSLTIATPDGASTSSTAASATTSSAYWPGTSVRARRAAPRTGANAAACASAHVANSARSSEACMVVRSLADDPGPDPGQTGTAGRNRSAAAATTGSMPAAPASTRASSSLRMWGSQNVCRCFATSSTATARS